MQWLNPIDEAPKDGQEVLVSVDGVYYVAMYQQEKDQFRIEDELRDTVFKIGKHSIYWTHFTKPEQP